MAAKKARESYERQLKHLGEAAEAIRILDQELARALKGYRTNLERAAEAGFMREYLETLEAKYEEFSEIVSFARKRLKAHMNHISHLHDELVRLKNAAKG